jgi:hypothetical protein
MPRTASVEMIRTSAIEDNDATKTGPGQNDAGCRFGHVGGFCGLAERRLTSPLG